MFNNERTFGVEIEFVGDAGVVEEKVNRAGISCYVESYNHITKGYWKIITDSSVSADVDAGESGGGFEMVSPPLKGEEGLAQLRKVVEAMKEAGAIVNDTCGLHVHHDANDFTAQSFKNAIKIYSRFEEVLDALVIPSRRESHNSYCLTVNTMEHRKAATKSDTIGDIMDVIHGRYYKLNVLSYLTHGTIEFRQHQGTLDFEEMSNWIRLTQAIVERSADRPVKEGRTNTWKRFKKFLFIEKAEGNKYTSGRTQESAAMFKYYEKRQKELAA